MKLIPETRGKKLLALGRQAIFNGKEPAFKDSTIQYGAFITLYIKGKERGCAGTPYPKTPLEKLVQDCAIYAATKDPRYSEVLLEEANDLTLLLSILSSPKIIQPEKIQIGNHGIIITQEKQSALHLPHVPIEYGWNVETLLQKTCLKAGLPENAWSSGAEISAFETQRFFEKRRTKISPPKRKTTPPM